jgi:hypothetical protein
VGCGGARGALVCGRGAPEAANGDEQEMKRSRGGLLDALQN